MKCETCDKEVKGYGKTCDICRKRKSRSHNDVTEKVEEEIKENLEADKGSKVTPGFCHGCKEPQENKNVCICHKCIPKGVTHQSLGLEMCNDKYATQKRKIGLDLQE